MPPGKKSALHRRGAERTGMSAIIGQADVSPEEESENEGFEMVGLMMKRGSSNATSNDGDNDDGLSLSEFGDEFIADGDSSTGRPLTKVVNAQHGDFGAEGTATPRQVAINIFISFVGAGMLGMPFAFKQSGWLLGTIALAGVSAANIYAMLLLVKCRQKVESSGSAKAILGYGDLGREVLGTKGEAFVNIMLVISQVGFATAYIIFISANLYSMNSGYFHRVYVCFGCVPVLALLVQIRDMKRLSPFSLVADLAMLFGLSAVFLQDWENHSLHPDSTIHMAHWNNFLYVTGVSLYSMEGAAMILPLEASSADRKGFPKLLCLVVAGITLLMATFGTAGYFGFGDNTQAPITLNLVGSWANFVKCALCIALYLTYPIMMFPVSHVMEDMCLNDEQKPSILFRTCVVILTAFVAYAIPDFGKFLGLVGSSICVILGFILPCVIHLLLFDFQELSYWEVLIDISLISFGLIFGALGTYSSLMDLLD